LPFYHKINLFLFVFLDPVRSHTPKYEDLHIMCTTAAAIAECDGLDSKGSNTGMYHCLDSKDSNTGMYHCLDSKGSNTGMYHC